MIGATLQFVDETLCEAIDLRGGQRVLDVGLAAPASGFWAARRQKSAKGFFRFQGPGGDLSIANLPICVVGLQLGRQTPGYQLLSMASRRSSRTPRPPRFPRGEERKHESSEP